MGELQQLNYAKDNVKWLLDHADGLCDMKGLVYWAERVETLREEIKKEL